LLLLTGAKRLMKCKPALNYPAVKFENESDVREKYFRTAKQLVTKLQTV